MKYDPQSQSPSPELTIEQFCLVFWSSVTYICFHMLIYVCPQLCHFNGICSCSVIGQSYLTICFRLLLFHHLKISVSCLTSSEYSTGRKNRNLFNRPYILLSCGLNPDSCYCIQGWSERPAHSSYCQLYGRIPKVTVKLSP